MPSAILFSSLFLSLIKRARKNVQPSFFLVAATTVNKRDLIIMAVTSQIRIPLSFGEVLVADWQAAGLIKSSVLKPVFTTIEQSLVIRTMGTLSAADSHALREILTHIIG